MEGEPFLLDGRKEWAGTGGGTFQKEVNAKAAYMRTLFGHTNYLLPIVVSCILLYPSPRTSDTYKHWVYPRAHRVPLTEVDVLSLSSVFTPL